MRLFVLIDGLTRLSTKGVDICRTVIRPFATCCLSDTSLSSFVDSCVGLSISTRKCTSPTPSRLGKKLFVPFIDELLEKSFSVVILQLSLTWVIFLKMSDITLNF